MHPRRQKSRPTPDPSPASSADLAREATLASARAMAEGRLTEAKALAALAETYARLGERGQTVETLDLALIVEVLADDNGVVARRLAWNPDRVDDPERAVKRAYQDRLSEARQDRTHHQMALVRRIHAAEAEVRRLGGEVVVSQSGFDALADERDWLLSVMEELDDVAVTPSPPPGDPWKVGL